MYIDAVRHRNVSRAFVDQPLPGMQFMGFEECDERKRENVTRIIRAAQYASSLKMLLQSDIIPKSGEIDQSRK